MGVLTLADFRSELVLSLRSRSDLSDAQLDRWINQAYLHLCRPEVHRHRELRNNFDLALVAGQDVYSLDVVAVGFNIIAPYDVVYYDALAISNTAPRHDVRPRTVNWFNRSQTPSVAGGPRHYLWDQEQIQFSPVPTATEAGRWVRLSVWREPDLLVLPTDTTLLGNYWDRALVLGSRWIAQDTLGLGEEAIASQQKYALYINETADQGELQEEDTDFLQEIKREPYL